jgi:hypothetical protein
MARADARDDRIIAVDANPDRGTLADRITHQNGKTVRDLVRERAQISGYAGVSSVVARDDTRLDVLASDADPRVSEAFSDRDYHDVATLAAHYYSIVLTDTGTGVVHSVMQATLELADQLVIVSGLSVDEADSDAVTSDVSDCGDLIGQIAAAIEVDIDRRHDQRRGGADGVLPPEPHMRRATGPGAVLGAHPEHGTDAGWHRFAINPLTLVGVEEEETQSAAIAHCRFGDDHRNRQESLVPEQPVAHVESTVQGVGDHGAPAFRGLGLGRRHGCRRRHASSGFRPEAQWRYQEDWKETGSRPGPAGEHGRSLTTRGCEG